MEQMSAWGCLVKSFEGVKGVNHAEGIFCRTCEATFSKALPCVFRPPHTSFLAHLPDFSINAPMTHLRRFKTVQMMNRGIKVRSVNLESKKAVGMLMIHTKAESKRKVIKVWPPERRVK